MHACRIGPRTESSFGLVVASAVLPLIIISGCERRNDSPYAKTGYTPPPDPEVTPIPAQATAGLTLSEPRLVELAFDGKMESFSFSSDLQLFAAGIGYSKVVVGESNTGNLISEFKNPDGTQSDQYQGAGLISRVAFSPPEPILAINLGGKVALGDPTTGKVRKMLSPINAKQPFLSWSADGDTLAVGAKDIEVWNVETGRRNPAFVGSDVNPRRRVTSGGYAPTPTNPPAGFGHALSTDGSSIAVGLPFWEIDIWNTETGRFARALSRDAGVPSISSSSQTRRLVYSPDATTLAASYDDLNLLLWGTTDWSSIAVLKQHYPRPGTERMEIRSIAFSKNGQWVAAGGTFLRYSSSDPFFGIVSQEGRISIWETETGARVHTMELDSDHIVEALAFSGEKNELAAFTTNQTEPTHTGPVGRRAINRLREDRVLIWTFEASQRE